jgi:cysteinyl-tRNA synthetase
VDLTLFNTLTRRKQPFEPTTPGVVDTPGALAVFFDYIREQNRSGEVPGSSAYALINDMNDLFDAFDRGDDRTTDKAAVEAALSRRRELRAARRFAEADAIRDELHAQGIVIEDSAGGTRWWAHEQ